MKLELTEQEGQVLVGLIDAAVKVKGLEAAEVGIYFFKKIKEGFELEKNTDQIKKE
jgi:hypothetical protein